MTFEFSFLKNYNPNLSNEKVIEVLKSFDEKFFSGWLKFNDIMRPNTPIENCIIDYPATMVDEIGVKLKSAS